MSILNWFAFLNPSPGNKRRLPITAATRRVQPSVCELPGIETLGSNFPPYSPSYEFPGEFIDAEHLAIFQLPLIGALINTDIQGFLRPADALTLYEHAYFVQGDVLELGSAWGLSTRILAYALCNAGSKSRVVSIEIDPGFQQATGTAISAAGLNDFYEAIYGDAALEVDRLIMQGRRFGLIFIDHDHSFASSRKICQQLSAVLTIGGIAIFHDFNDARNLSEPETYGVYLAVAELAQQPDFLFRGIIGCCALIQRTA